MSVHPPRLSLTRASTPPGRRDPAFLDELWTFISDFVVRPRDAFERALADFEFVTTWRERGTGRLLGFSANKILPMRVGDRPVVVIYSGWAILSPELRGRNLIQGEGFRCAAIAKRRHPFTPAYWFFGASTYKSYLLMPRNFAAYFPRRDVAWPPFERTLRDQLMAQMSEPGWDPDAGVIRRHGVSRYLDGVVQDDPAVLADPDVAFYAGCNPHQTEGDTLISLVPLSAENWGHLLKQSVARRKRKSIGQATAKPLHP
jgi:hypothetical protein